MSIDLHVHTTFSDGEFSPSQIIALAQEKGIKTLAITDHDSVDGLHEASACSRIEVINGVELGADEKDTEIHILGYLFDHEDEKLIRALQDLRAGREKRNRAMIEKLRALGMDMSMEDVQKKVIEGSAGRPHIASVMIDRGYVSSFKEAFEKFLAKGKPAYVEREKVKASECIRLICDAGGVPVLAHPKFIKGDLEAIVSEYVGCGLQGLEVYYAEHTYEERKTYAALAEKHNLVMTGGTDFHGSLITPGVELGGTLVPPHVPGALKKRWMDGFGKFREMRREDVEGIVRMTKKQVGGVIHEAWKMELPEPMLLSMLEENQTFVLCVRDVVLGYVTLEYETDHLFCYSMILREDMTGFGAGELLMRKVIEEALKGRYSEIRLNVQTPNVHAIRFYARWGFRKTREWNNNVEMVLKLRN